MPTIDRTVVIDEWLEGDFGVEGQPLRLVIYAFLDEDEASFEIETSLLLESGEPFCKAGVKATVTNPVDFAITIPAVITIYGTCVGARLAYSTVDFVVQSYADSKKQNGKASRWERCKDTFTRFIKKRDEMKQSAVGSLIKCAKVWIGD